MEEKKPARGSHAPGTGTFWYYNNWDFNTLSYIYEQSAGKKTFDAFYREIAQPIGMQDFRGTDIFTGPDTRFPAYPFEMSVRDLARFVLLYLHGGKWNGTW
jgi:CubicO group peptidase (beta-lactamase class C family)